MDLIEMLIEKRGMTFQDATTTLYNSDTYEKLQDVDTGFYYQSPGYVYAFLENELTTGKCCDIGVKSGKSQPISSHFLY